MIFNEIHKIWFILFLIYYSSILKSQLKVSNDWNKNFIANQDIFPSFYLKYNHKFKNTLNYLLFYNLSHLDF